MDAHCMNTHCRMLIAECSLHECSLHEYSLHECSLHIYSLHECSLHAHCCCVGLMGRHAKPIVPSIPTDSSVPMLHSSQVHKWQDFKVSTRIPWHGTTFKDRERLTSSGVDCGVASTHTGNALCMARVQHTSIDLWLSCVRAKGWRCWVGVPLASISWSMRCRSMRTGASACFKSVDSACFKSVDIWQLFMLRECG
jgi:hypothetical protein